MDAFISVFEHNHAGVAAPERDSHVTHGFWAKWVLLGNAIYPAPIPLFPFSPSTDLSTGLDSPETGGCPTPAEAHHSQFLWNAEAGRRSLALSTVFPS